MGQDKAAIRFDGEQLAVRIARSLDTVCDRVTIIGREPIPGYLLIKDLQEFAGPLVALSQLQLTSERVFVASCDIVHFDARLVTGFQALIGSKDAVIPIADGRLQPLCALYRASAWQALKLVLETGSARLMDWIEALDVQELTDKECLDLGLDPAWVRSANTPAELKRLLGA